MQYLSVATVASLAIFIVVAWSGFKNGLFSALVMLVISVLSAMMSVGLMAPLASVPFVARMGWYAPPILYLGVFIFTMGILQTVANYLYPPKLTMPKTVHRVGGVVVGVVIAYFLTGFLMVGFMLFPGTGDIAGKAVLPGADVFFVKAMAWLSSQTGSVALDADKFLDMARKEKEHWDIRQPKNRDNFYNEFSTKNETCVSHLKGLGMALEGYVQATRSYPKTLQDLLPYVPEHYRPRREGEDILVCPATGYRYRLFPARDYDSMDRNSIVIYDAVGGNLGHTFDRGAGDYVRDKYAVALKDGRVRWLNEKEFRADLKAQDSLKAAPEESAE